MLHADMTTMENAADNVACRLLNAALSASLRARPMETSLVDVIDMIGAVLNHSREARRKTGKTFRTEPLSVVQPISNLDLQV
jgi:hypothetical protein